VHQPSPDISQDERAFFVQLGVHIAELRTSADITQGQLAAFLGVSPQKVVNSMLDGLLARAGR
jgi:DNA-binding XRE family transcriptional regulator